VNILKLIIFYLRPAVCAVQTRDEHGAGSGAERIRSSATFFKFGSGFEILGQGRGKYGEGGQLAPLEFFFAPPPLWIIFAPLP